MAAADSSHGGRACSPTSGCSDPKADSSGIVAGVVDESSATCELEGSCTKSGPKTLLRAPVCIKFSAADGVRFSATNGGKLVASV